MLKIELQDLFDLLEREATEVLKDGSRFTRLRTAAFHGAEILSDRFESTQASCCFARFGIGEAQTMRFSLTGTYRLKSGALGGWLALPVVPEEPAYWFPRPPLLRALDAAGHILDEKEPEISGMRAAHDALELEIRLPRGFFLDWVAWQLPAAEKKLIGEFKHVTTFEQQPIFLWGSHTTYRRASDLYLHLIDGRIYENRYAWPFKRKICSENDAHALYVALSGLERSTGKRLYSLLKQQVLYSVIARQSADGGWRHGEWTDGMETHYRLHGSAMHLLMDALEESSNQTIQQALAKAARFVCARADQTEVGTWFLHDSLEASVSTMKQGPFRWVESKHFGKSPSNMLVLNTHLDTTIVLDRYARLTGDQGFAARVHSAHSATRAVLAAQPGQWIYRPLFWAIGLTLLPKSIAQKLPLPLRVVKRLAWKYLVPRWAHVKSLLPRLVMPRGFIDRALSLHGLPDDYQSINVMDLVRYQRRFHDDVVGRVLDQAVSFTRKHGIRRYWKEDQDKKYALGFWAECLYHLYMAEPTREHCAWLAEAILDLEDAGLGIPASLLGCNAEALPASDHAACLLLADRRVRVANLSGRNRLEFLAVNPSQEELSVARENAVDLDIKWVRPNGEDLREHDPVTIAPRSWLLARIVPGR